MSYSFPAQVSPDATSSIMGIEEAAAYIGLAKSTLYTWRTRRPGYGPRAVKAGGALRYRRSDLDAWIEAHVEQSALTPELAVEVRAEHYHTAGERGLDSVTRRPRPRL